MTEDWHPWKGTKEIPGNSRQTCVHSKCSIQLPGKAALFAGTDQEKSVHFHTTVSRNSQAMWFKWPNKYIFVFLNKLTYQPQVVQLVQGIATLQYVISST